MHPDLPEKCGTVTALAWVVSENALEGTSGAGGHRQASASHLAQSFQPDHLGRDTQFKSPLEASRTEFVSAQASRLS